MMAKTSVWGCAALALIASGCQMEVGEQGETVETVSEALESCVNPANNSGNVCNLGGGQLKFQVRLPSGQSYVEVFSRQNGTQNVATAITGSAVSNGDGTSTYSLTRSGYAAADKVEYRFYSYLPSSPGVFTPGAAESVWYGYISAVAVTKDAAAIYSSYGLGLVPNQNFGSSATVDIGEYHLTSEGFFAYSLGSVPSGAVISKAELVIGGAFAPGGSPVALRLNRITGSWSESTITWNNRPAYTYSKDVTVTAGSENRIDVTSEVSASLASGEAGIALQPSTSGSSADNVFIDAKEKSGGVPTTLTVHWKK
jgi:hypothetical protein